MVKFKNQIVKLIINDTIIGRLDEIHLHWNKESMIPELEIIDNEGIVKWYEVLNIETDKYSVNIYC